MTDRQKTRRGSGKAKAKGVGRGAGTQADQDKGSSQGASEHADKTAAAEYEVGYGRPPLNTRFQKGQPRPPRKPKPETEQSFEDYFAEELKLPMRFVDETGKEQVFPKGKVLAKTSVNKALKSGDLRQIKEFIPRRRASEGTEVSQVDLEMVARFLANWLPGGLADIGLADPDEAAGEADANDGGEAT